MGAGASAPSPKAASSVPNLATAPAAAKPSPSPAKSAKSASAPKLVQPSSAAKPPAGGAFKLPAGPRFIDLADLEAYGSLPRCGTKPKCARHTLRCAVILSPHTIMLAHLHADTSTP